MKLIITEDFEEMSQVAANIILGKMYQNKHRVNLSLTGGRTPKRIYEVLIEKTNGQTFQNVHYYNFDEGRFNGGEANVTFSELEKLYYAPANINTDNLHRLTLENYLKWDKMIANDGGIELIMMGIGADGHFCANMPGTNVFSDLKTRKIEGTLDGTEYEFVTMGAQSVMMSKELLLIANGEEKAEIIQKALEGPVTEDIPASILKMHPNITVILDKDAASKLKS